MRKLALTGQVFGRLTVTSEGLKKGTRLRWNCLCVCGNTTLVMGSHLKNSHTSSCGCLWEEQLIARSITHNAYYTQTYKKYRSALSRCTSPGNSGYKDYGGRGIKVLWPNFEAFLSDMGECPEGYSLERLDVNGDYSKANCVWIPLKDQAKNKRRTIRVLYEGKQICLADAAKVAGVGYNHAYHKLKVLKQPVEIVLGEKFSTVKEVRNV